MSGHWNVFSIVWLAGMLVGVSVRAGPMRRARRASRSGGRATTASARWDSAVLALSALGMPVLPLVYLFTPWLNAFDYRLPAAAG